MFFSCTLFYNVQLLHLIMKIVAKIHLHKRVCIIYCGFVVLGMHWLFIRNMDLFVFSGISFILSSNETSMFKE